MPSDLDHEIDRLLAVYSESDLKNSISRIARRKSPRELTVVVNFGMHALPEYVLRGDTFFFSEGNVDLSSENISGTIQSLSRRALRFLRGKVWEKVYIIPSGHPVLVSMCTLICYRVTRINPTIVYYLDGVYIDAKLDLRGSALRDNSLR